jgi:predicted RNA-binding protein with PUA-like domain
LGGKVKRSIPEQGGWLFKEEPEHYSYADLERDGNTLWSGVSNPLALKHLREVRRGDRVLYYHTGKERAIVGEMRVVEGATHDPEKDDPRAVVVNVEPAGRWTKPLTLERIKKDKALAGWELVRLPRLSVMPVTREQWQRLEELRSEPE